MAARGERVHTRGYHCGDVDTVLSVDDVDRQARAFARQVPVAELQALARQRPYLQIEALRAGYGKMAILHDFDLAVAKGQSLCLIGPNGAGKSTILHSIFGFTNIFEDRILIGKGAQVRDITRLSSNQKLKEAGIAYVLQDQSVFPGMTVEENLLMVSHGGRRPR